MEHPNDAIIFSAPTFGIFEKIKEAKSELKDIDKKRKIGVIRAMTIIEQKRILKMQYLLEAPTNMTI